MRYHERFEWDPSKAKSNYKDHRVTFDAAAAVLDDEYHETFHLEDYDDAHSEEEHRRTTIGSLPQDRDVVLMICWTERHDEELRFTRIISARRVTKSERRIYARYVEKTNRR